MFLWPEYLFLEMIWFYLSRSHFLLSFLLAGNIRVFFSLASSYSLIRQHSMGKRRHRSRSSSSSSSSSRSRSRSRSHKRRSYRNYHHHSRRTHSTLSITQARRFLGERGYRTTQLQPAHVQAAQLFRQATTSLPTTLTVSTAIVETDSSMAQTVDTPQPGLNNTLDSANLSRDERLAYEALSATCRAQPRQLYATTSWHITLGCIISTTTIICCSRRMSSPVDNEDVVFFFEAAAHVTLALH